ncbi:MBL fold metallo-hydrolase [Priestia filamentosa]|uniref:MBL fold metallo-hydrolase n=1 Tax=Priestia filamentosa TaxID=1402861 RepID=UPI000317B5B8|nr:MBL fold metallo-hydrolase [Priestia filamentosa]
MDIKKLTDKIYYLPHNPEFDRPLLGYIKGSKYNMMIDAGTSDKHVEEFNNGLLKNNLKNPDFVAITHWHWDHTFGMHAVNGVTIAHEKTNEKLHELKNQEWSEQAMKERVEQGKEIEFKNEEFRNEYKDLNEIKIITADIIVDKELVFNLGDVTAHIFHVEAPHSDDSMLIYVPEEKILFIGDSTSEDFYNNHYLDKDKLNSLIKTLESINFTHCLLGHTDPLKKSDILGYLNTLL